MKNLLHCCIIEDEPLAQEILETFIARVPFLKLLATFSNPLEASAILDKEKPEILFLDINLPDVDGLSFISMLSYKSAIILTTAYDNFALKSYELEVSDYLLKPFSFERFYKGVNKVFHQYNQHSKRNGDSVEEKKSPDPDFLFFKVGHRIQKVELNDILFVQGMKDYLQIHTSNEKIMVLMNFAKMNQLLPTAQFVRVHKSFIVAINKIEHIERNRILIGKVTIPISETYGEMFIQRLKGISDDKL